MSNFRRRHAKAFKDPDSWRGEAARRRDIRSDPVVCNEPHCVRRHRYPVTERTEHIIEQVCYD